MKLFVLKKSLTPEQAFQKIKQYCAYQERSHSETKDKLYSFGLFKSDVEIILSKLIEENYLNEERYAQHFAGGHFRLKKWGKIKIKAALQQKKVSAYNIKIGLKEIDDADYLKCLSQLTVQKWKLLASEQWINRMAKTTNYLLQKGFEPNLIQESIAHLRSKE
ncbi:MAG: RecX family transcriptional regulator [Chitinophagaceae bacterium]|nr:RecX family transcriptional regulator [Chitinophagaceae bacterium]